MVVMRRRRMILFCLLWVIFKLSHSSSVSSCSNLKSETQSVYLSLYHKWSSQQQGGRGFESSQDMSLNLSSFYNIFWPIEQWGGVLFQPWGSHRGERIWSFPENERVRQYHSARPHFTISTLKFSRKSATMPFNSSLFYKINLEVLKGERGGDENGPGVSVSVSTLNFSSNWNNSSGENGDSMNWNGNGEKPMTIF